MVDVSVIVVHLKPEFYIFLRPAFHPVLKAIMPARKALAAEGQKTIFNDEIDDQSYQPKHQLMGVYSRSWIDPIAEAMTF